MELSDSWGKETDQFKKDFKHETIQIFFSLPCRSWMYLYDLLDAPCFIIGASKFTEDQLLLTQFTLMSLACLCMALACTCKVICLCVV